MQGLPSVRRPLFPALLGIALLTIGGAIKDLQAAPPLQDAHRAFYTLAIGKVKGSATIVGVSGAMTSEWERGCEGWTGTQKLSVTMQRQEGPPTESEVSASVFESHDGTRLRFTSRTMIDDEVIEQVRGRAIRPAFDVPGQAVYAEPPGKTINLPARTLFPYQHTLAIIDAALTSRGRDYSPFFDGSQPDESPLLVNSLILGKARSATEGPGAGLGPLTDHIWWPVRLAFFAAEGTGGSPEIEMTQYLQDNGVVRRFDFDYGDFTIIAMLARIEAIVPPDCR